MDDIESDQLMELDDQELIQAYRDADGYGERDLADMIVVEMGRRGIHLSSAVRRR